MPAWTIGTYTIIMNFIFVFLQILILRKNFELMQLFQLVIGFFFGILIDLNIVLTTWIDYEALWANALTQIAGCTILGIGITFEVKCGSVTMPGEGLPLAIRKVTGKEFAMVYVGVIVRMVTKRIGWFERLLAYKPGIRRYMYGLKEKMWKDEK